MENKHIPSYLAETPLLPDYLEDGLSAMGVTCEEVEAAHL
jgi:hypothetical protein